ncbi:cell wall-active antibiotics response protein [Irregularibacter muris]|uniref:Cell wall-active antibiotics response protein n=1 Tax=Irregularibacter muris TaxID=1796619 RepID=A0AAE3HF85_9FIRM|nr:cell wall-active antibiotics response protein [Irregularibacter muris]MCR1899470.1 cell wall-active antibiotics response protein [Irregularibacter muris]
MRIFKGRWLIGLIIIIFGISLLLENLGLAAIDFDYVFKMLIPLALILWGIDVMFRKQGWLSTVGGLILLLLGVSQLGRNFGWFIIDLSILWDLFWPLVIIFMGISIITSIKPGSKNNLAFMGGVDRGKAKWVLKNDTYTAIMGGIELDLRWAEIAEGETNIQLTAIMGGIDVIVPSDITVHCTGNVVLGGLDLLDRSTGGLVSSLQADQIGNTKVVNIQCNVALGGIEIVSKN